ncbi:cytochrome b/b6 domain-containing protein [Sphingomonas radiodurans]|uniref:cytochrome b/b6 domain-containing protein n=1 Tax=Sphingomonas radiodurans TaxID=2890321 RepID=UPI001E2C6409|nr:cytochrome b/b6 domain-containing protein [Sphingomonas radiodurans]WBH15322.1 cytochrome b/b6 domain-containing protein [Sphingomonas radiodurans]
MTGITIAAAPGVKTIKVWDLPVRLFHWLLVATILVAFLSAEEGSPLSAWHIPAGWIAAVLIAFRLVWGLVGGEHARFADFLKPGRIGHHLAGLFSGRPERSIGHNALGGVAIIALLGTVAGIIYTGATMRGDTGEELHEALGNILLGLIALHVVAVIAMSMLTRDNLIAAFITGRKRADLHPGVPDARAPINLAIPVAIVAIGGAAYGITSIDPLAFNSGAHSEAGEAEGGETGGGDDD